jgi:tetratricopeptide (TPR) repeat protein
MAMTARDPVRAGRAERLRARILRQSGRAQEALSVLDALEPRLMMPAAHGERAHCALLRGLIALDAGRTDSAQRRFEEADALFMQAKETDARLWVQLAQGHLACVRGHHRLARTLGRDAEQGFKAAGNDGGRLAARYLRAEAAAGAGDHATAEERYSSLQVLADARGWLLDTIDLRLIRVRLALAQNQPHDALGLLQEADIRSRLLGLDALTTLISAVRPAVLAATGDHATARSALTTARLPDVALRARADAIVRAALGSQSTQRDTELRARLQRWSAQFEAR